MTPEDFDAWRERYDEMTYRDQMEFYDQVEIEHPCQKSFSVAAHNRFFWYVTRGNGRLSIIEFGGWKGELAKSMLSSWSSIKKWRNFEICHRAAHHPVCKSPRYSAFVPSSWVWELGHASADAVIASHFIEHIKQKQLDALVGRLSVVSVRYLALQAPLPVVDDPDWSGYHGSHILEIGWEKVIAMLAKHGYCEIVDLHDGDFRAFERVQ